MHKFASILLLFVCISLQTTAQSKLYDSIKSTVSSAAGGVTETIKDTYNTIDTSGNIASFGREVKSAIVTLASSLKVGAEHVYGVLVKKYLVEGIAQLVIGIIMLIAMYKITVIAFNFAKKNDTEDSAGVVYIPIVFLSAIFLFGGYHILTSLPETLNKIINPEWDAINFILSKIK
jgi:hypothetical protein